jgi:hypothetical protein
MHSSSRSEKLTLCADGKAVSERPKEMTSYSQPGIFNALDYGLRPSPIGTAAGNQSALQTAIYAAEQAGGGIVLIPSEYDNDVVYPIQGPIYVSSATSMSPVAVIIAGTGQGSESTPILQVSGDGDLFSVGYAPRF